MTALAGFFSLLEVSPSAMPAYKYLSLRSILENTFLAVIYMGAAKIGLMVAIPETGGNVTLLWPPTGIAYVAVFSYGYRIWPGLALGAFFINLINEGSPAFSFITAIGNPLPAIVAFYILRRFTSFQKSLAHLTDVYWFLAVPVFLSTTLSASIGTVGLCLTGLASWTSSIQVWLNWWLGDSMGVLLLSPVFCTAVGWRKEPWTVKRIGELVLMILLLTTGSIAFFTDFFGYTHGSHSPIDEVYFYLIFPIAIWFAVRHQQHGAALAIMIVTVFTIIGDVIGHGPFLLDDIQRTFTHTLFFLIAFAIVSLVLAADVTERERSVSALRESEAMLKATVENLSFIHATQTQFIQGSEPRQLFKSMLASLLSLTESEYGFVGEVLYTEEGQPYLKIHAITDDSWDKKTRKRFKQNEETGLEFYNLETLSRAVIISGETVISNDLINDSHSGDAAKGPPVLRHFLGLPFEQGDGLLGLIGIANRAGGYDQRIVDHLQPFLASCAGLIASFRNEKRRKVAEKRLKKTNRRLEKTLDELKQTQVKLVRNERLRSMGEMASGIAHDFNNSLMLIFGFAELLVNHPEILEDREKVMNYIKQIHRAAEDAGEVVNRLSDFYRPKDQESVFRPIHLNSLIEETLVQTRPRWKNQTTARGGNIMIVKDFNKVPQILGLPGELREMLKNLIFNAVDAIFAEGTITLRTRFEHRTDKELDANIMSRPHSNTHKYLLLEVSDTGSGMDKKTLKRCLDPFFTTKGENGTGLGLSVSYGIIERHHGEVDIHSEPGKGTTIKIFLPYFADDVEQGNEGEVITESGPLHILLIYDEPKIMEIVSIYLQKDSHTFETASNGQEALEVFRSMKFDLVIADYAMPEINGNRLTAILREIDSNIPFILLTGLSGIMDAAREIPSGINVMLKKPITADLLRKAVQEAMGVSIT